MRRAWRAWAWALALGAAAVAALAIAVPAWQSLIGPPAGEAAYGLLAHVCHQFPSRSFWLLDRPMGLCARCVAGYSGIALGALLFLRDRGFARPLLAGLVLFALGVAEPVLAITTDYEGAKAIRALAGLLGGLGLFFVLCPIRPRPVARRMIGGSEPMMKTVALGALLILVVVPTHAEARQVRLKNGSVVVVKTRETLSGNEVRAGDEVVLLVGQPVTVNGSTVIEAGAPVIGFVDEAEEADMAGKAGEIRISLRLVTAVDGTNVTLSGQMVGRGEDQIGRNVAIGVILCPFVLLDKGGPGIIGAGREVRALTIGDFDIDVRD